MFEHYVSGTEVFDTVPSLNTDVNLLDLPANLHKNIAAL